MRFFETFLPQCIAKITLILFKQNQLEDDELDMIFTSVTPGALEAEGSSIVS